MAENKPRKAVSDTPESGRRQCENCEKYIFTKARRCENCSYLSVPIRLHETTLQALLDYIELVKDGDAPSMPDHGNGRHIINTKTNPMPYLGEWVFEADAGSKERKAREAFVDDYKKFIDFVPGIDADAKEVIDKFFAGKDAK